MPVLCQLLLISDVIFLQVLTDDEFQHLRIKKACESLPQRKGPNKEATLLAAVEEQRLVLYINVT